MNCRMSNACPSGDRDQGLVGGGVGGFLFFCFFVACLDEPTPITHVRRRVDDYTTAVVKLHGLKQTLC